MWHNCLCLFLASLLFHSATAVWQCSVDSECQSLAGSVCAEGTCVCPATQQVVAGGTRCADFWQCTVDSECQSLAGSVCAEGTCVCPATRQVMAGGTGCADFAPYLTSSCVEDFQCQRLFTAFQCRLGEGQSEGACFCQPGHHYFHGRCWESIPAGDPCTRDEECMGAIRDPFAMTCDGTCQCAEGYYTRQRGECRRIGAAVGDGCVLDDDCQFTNGVCHDREFTCYDSTNPASLITRIAYNTTVKMAATNMAARIDGALCSASNPCSAPFECSSVGICVCPLGYYGSADGASCLAELGSPSTAQQCVGVLAVIEDGICTCPPNFFYEENMRDCTKVVRTNTDFCFSDEQCHTLGAASFCGEEGQWGMRNCECDLEEAIWDPQRSMCRLFAGIGEACQVDSDCMAGDFEIQCELNEEGIGYCACPDGLVATDGLCLNFTLAIGDECQRSEECTVTENTACEGGYCSCTNGYQQVEDFCAPIIGGSCTANSDCVINNTICAGAAGALTCQCADSFVEYDDECWENSLGYNETCEVDAQCVYALGSSGACQDGYCLCGNEFHYRDGACWPMTGLFETCSRSSQCFLGELTDTVVCRNGLCQCDFNFPYSEEDHTCISSAASVKSSIFVILTTLVYMFSDA